MTELSGDPWEGRTRLSVSRWRSWSRCPFEYKLRRIDKLPDTPAAWTALGLALHATMETWENNDRGYELDACIEDFTTRFDSQIEEWNAIQPDTSKWNKVPHFKSVGADIAYYRKRGIQHDVKNYYLHATESTWLPYRFENGKLAVEVEFELPLGDDLLIHGFIDVIPQFEDGRMIIQDIKSGQPYGNDKRQLRLYGFAAQKLFGLPVKFGRNFYTKPRINRASDWVKLDATEEELTSLYREVARAVNPETGIFLPNPGDHCDLCPFRGKECIETR